MLSLMIYGNNDTVYDAVGMNNKIFMTIQQS